MSETQSTTDTPNAPLITQWLGSSAPEPRDTDTPAAPTWRDCPTLHTTGPSIAAKLRLIASTLEALGDNAIADTWLSVGIQVDGTKDPERRKATADTIAVALGVGQLKEDGDLYRCSLDGVSVYTATLHQPGCCEHCTIAGAS